MNPFTGPVSIRSHHLVAVSEGHRGCLNFGEREYCKNCERWHLHISSTQHFNIPESSCAGVSLGGLCHPINLDYEARAPATLTSWPLDPSSVKALMNLWLVYSLPSPACHSTHPDRKAGPFYFIFGPDANKAIARGLKRREEREEERWRREDENIKEMIAGRLSLFAAHQRGLRQGLAGEDKPTETQSTKSKKFLRHCLESLTRGTANNKEHNLDFLPPPLFSFSMYPST